MFRLAALILLGRKKYAPHQTAFLISTYGININQTSTHSYSYHSPPQGICIVPEVSGAPADGIRLCQVHKVRGEDKAQKADVQGRYQLLERGSKMSPHISHVNIHSNVFSW